MIYKSYCAIDIEYYPFDIQDCYMKFGTWTFDGGLINLEHIDKNNSIMEKNTYIPKTGISTKLYTVNMGIDMSDYYQSVEWDILSIPAQKNVKYYDCCAEPYHDIYFNITIRRKTLFYTVNLIIPCVNISFLSVLVFYLPSSSGEKIALGIYVLVALLVFYLLLIELIPPTSLVIPLLGKYLLFTLILVNLSIFLTIFILNLHHRKPSTHKMPIWMKRVFIQILPKILFIERPMIAAANNNKIKQNENNTKLKSKLINDNAKYSSKLPVSIRRALNGVSYMHGRMIKDDIDRKVKKNKHLILI
jgi:nicotinic acetylcholine receptor, invertebrate